MPTVFDYHNNVISQTSLFSDIKTQPPQLLKWVGNKHRFALKIIDNFPKRYNKYIEPFVGTGAVLAALNPHNGIAGDMLAPLIEIMKLLQDSPDTLIKSYADNWNKYQNDPKGHYISVLKSFNTSPNALDLLFLSRTCYGGVVRFTKEGKMSTPIGPHKPIPPESFAKRVFLWRERVANTKFFNADYRETMGMAEKDDIIYCDPPYVDSQAILYGAQTFKLRELFKEIEKAVSKGAKVVLSIDGHKKSGKKILDIDFPNGLFKQEYLINNGSSMLRRFQKSGETMEGEDVKDRLLLTW
ncbi:Dam family site-specific DNA-(adenine-N6)-methyltransferase [Candidatus Daviesbacteria bacterium]|nr:Dam family site-specific DNA-(adenine-N6)-methyltransferase [Candidatus Daviesbacteria bacterium]